MLIEDTMKQSTISERYCEPSLQCLNMTLVHEKTHIPLGINRLHKLGNRLNVVFI